MISSANNQFNVRASGGVRFVTGGAGMTLDGQPILAGTVGALQLAGTYPNNLTFSNPGNSFRGNGANLTGLNASALAAGTVDDAQRPGAGSTRVFRGGSWNFSAASCRSAQRISRNPDFAFIDLGFRVVLAPGQP